METEAKDGVGRRRILDFLLGSSLLAFLGTITYPVFRFLLPSQISVPQVSSVRVGKVSEFNRNSGKLFRFGRHTGILVRTPSGEFRAFNAQCTHLTCNVQYRDDIEHIWCACHNGHFDLSGKNIAGPPPRPLEQFEAKIRGEEVFVSRKV